MMCTGALPDATTALHCLISARKQVHCSAWKRK